MKIGPNWFPTTYTGATGQGTFVTQSLYYGMATSPTIYNTQNLNTTFTSLPIDCRGLYDVTVQLVGSPSSSTVVEVDVSIDPQAWNPVCTTATWFSIGSISTTPSMVVHTGIKRAMRCLSKSVNGNTDNFTVVFMGDDRG